MDRFFYQLLGKKSAAVTTIRHKYAAATAFTIQLTNAVARIGVTVGKIEWGDVNNSSTNVIFPNLSAASFSFTYPAANNNTALKEITITLNTPSEIRGFTINPNMEAVEIAGSFEEMILSSFVVNNNILEVLPVFRSGMLTFGVNGNKLTAMAINDALAATRNTVTTFQAGTNSTASGGVMQGQNLPASNQVYDLTLYPNLVTAHLGYSRTQPGGIILSTAMTALRTLTFPGAGQTALPANIPTGLTIIRSGMNATDNNSAFYNNFATAIDPVTQGWANLITAQFWYSFSSKTAAGNTLLNWYAAWQNGFFTNAGLKTLDISRPSAAFTFTAGASAFDDQVLAAKAAMNNSGSWSVVTS